MSTVDFDYDAFLDGLESSSNTTTSPTTSSDNDLDSGIAYTPPMPTAMDNTVIDLDDPDILQLNMESSLPIDPNYDFNSFSPLFDEKNPLLFDETSTFENLFSDFDLSVQQSQETPQQPKPITNCYKLQTYSSTTPTGPTCFRLEPINPKPNITIIKTSQPIKFANVPVITMPLATNDSTIKQMTKRRRSDSPAHSPEVSEVQTLTLDHLKRQYGNMSDEALKKHLRMIKNRESASLSRKRRKDLMENLDSRVKDLTDENEQLKKDNSKLLTRVHTLELENKLLKNLQPRKPLVLLGIVLLVGFNIFTLKSLAPSANLPSGSMALYDNQGAVVPGRTILSERRSNNDNSYLTSSEQDYGSDGGTSFSNNPAVIPTYPYIQCVAYINKTHSKRINQDLHSLVQEHSEKRQDTKPVIIEDSKFLTIPSDSVARPTTDLQHISRKVARQTKIQSESKGQLQPYKTYEANYDDFIHTLDRKNDTLYFVSFKRDHLILPATEQNQTQRPKMSLILPASMANLNKSIHIPTNHVPMIKIDCEVEDTKLVFVNAAHIPQSYRNTLFQYYSSASHATI